ncbi:helix-turn-helix domain-containing protein [Brevundimonas sp.]
MNDMPLDRMRDGNLLSEAVRGVRRFRGMTVTETAEAMHVSLRTYQRFEAGETRLNLDHLHRFAAATRSDPYALLVAVAIGAPAFAIHCADNKLGSVVTIALQKLDETLGARVAELDTRSLVSAVTVFTDRLTQQVLDPDPARTWFEEGQAHLKVRRPRPGR